MDEASDLLDAVALSPERSEITEGTLPSAGT